MLGSDGVRLPPAFDLIATIDVRLVPTIFLTVLLSQKHVMSLWGHLEVLIWQAPKTAHPAEFESSGLCGKHLPAEPST